MPGLSPTRGISAEGAQYVYDAAGNIVGLVGVGGYVINLPIDGLSTTNSAAAATSNVTRLQAALTAAGLGQITTPGIFYTNDPLFMGEFTTLALAAGVTLKSNSVYRHTMIRVGNADFSGDAAAIEGVSILCATHGTAAGTGAMKRYTGPARLSWTAPGDTEGSLVDVSGGTGRYTLTSANGKSIHVTVVTASLGGATNAPVKVAAVTGAKACTWSRTSNVTTVTQTAHGRRPGHMVLTFGTNFVGQHKIATATADTYTFADSRSNGSGSGEAFGVMRPMILGESATIDYAMSAGTSPRNVSQAHAVVFVGANDFCVDAGIRDCLKYGVYVQGASDGEVDLTFYSDHAGSSTAAFQINGKTSNVQGTARGRSSDTLTAVCNGDYVTQTYLLATDEGGVDNEDWHVKDVHGEDCKYELVRVVGCTGAWQRRGRITNINGTVESTTTKGVSTMVDAGMYNAGETNIDGLIIDGVSITKSGSTQMDVVNLTTAGSTRSRGVVVRNVQPTQAVEANGQGAVNIAGGNWEDITVEHTANKSPSFQGFGVVTTNSPDIKTLRVLKTSLTIDNALKNTGWTSGAFRAIGGTIGELILDENFVRDISATGTKADLWRIESGATVHHLVSDRQKGDGVTGIGNFNGNATCRITARNLMADAASGSVYCLRFDAPAAQVDVGSVVAPVSGASLVDVVRIGYSSATMKVRSLGGMPATPSSGYHVNVASGTSNSPDVNGADLMVDLTKLAAVRGNLVRNGANGDVCMYTSGAAWTAIV